MIVAVGLLGIWLGIITNRANRQRRAIETIRKAGGEVWYDYQFDDWGETKCVTVSMLNVSHIRPDAPPPSPGWLRRLIGIDYFATVAVVNADRDIENAAVAMEDLPQLKVVALHGRQVTDSTLIHLRDLTHLRALLISDPSVSDTGWNALEHLTHLQTLLLNIPVIRDSPSNCDVAVSHIRNLNYLTDLELYRSGVTNAGLAHLDGLSRLENLDLTGCGQITDAGLAHLTNLTRLKYLNIFGSRATQAGVQRLRRSTTKLWVDGL
jgi:hypothetical protein